jgi:LmbE family N-acetylglucosaminyl deacetylase
MMFFSCREDVTKFAPTESFPNDSILPTISEKRAMVVIAHDDDMCGIAGTISKLKKQGWKLIVLSFPQTEERNTAHRIAGNAILDSVTFFSLKPSQYRNDLDKNDKLYQAIAKENFKHIFNQPIVESELIRRVKGFNPSVIFTLDNEIGAYGHPEHVFISQIILDLAQADSIRPDYIYQSVYTKHMTETIMKRHSEQMKEWGFPGNEWEYAKETYKVKGMPEPSVQINITSEAHAKMNFLKSYNERERKTLNFYIPAFEKYSAEDYFKIFDREFFRIIKVN